MLLISGATRVEQEFGVTDARPHTLKLVNAGRAPISVVEWAYLSKGKFQRRDFRLDVLTGAASFSAEDSLFSQLGRHESFTPTKVYPPMTLCDLAGFASGETGDAA